MSRLVTLIVLTGILAGCQSTYQNEPPPPIVGPMVRSQLTDAFLHAYPEEPIGEPFLAMIRQAHAGVHVLVFMGTWCSDSKRDVPRFLRIADGSGMDATDFDLYGLDRKKKSPGGLEEKYSIERVPTFIFLRGGRRSAGSWRPLQRPWKGIFSRFWPSRGREKAIFR